MTPPASMCDGVSPETNPVRLAEEGAPSISVPPWVRSTIESGDHQHRHTIDGPFRIAVSEARDASLISITLANARSLSARELRTHTRKLYSCHRDLIGANRHPARIWNFIPGITQPMPDGDAGLDRYMAFNLGRHDAVEDWFRGQLTERLPAATGVGHAGDDLHVHMLVLQDAPLAVENPRQRPAFCYSEKFGPKPPCFARASVVTLAGERTLLVAGTASILGEESLHEGSLDDQIDETLCNLRALIESVRKGDDDPLAALKHVRAYAPVAEHHGAILTRLSALPGERAVEMVTADLCRSELLVEIEGIVPLGRDTGERDS